MAPPVSRRSRLLMSLQLAVMAGSTLALTAPNGPRRMLVLPIRPRAARALLDAEPVAAPAMVAATSPGAWTGDLAAARFVAA